MSAWLPTAARGQTFRDRPFGPTTDIASLDDRNEAVYLSKLDRWEKPGLSCATVFGGRQWLALALVRTS